MNGIGFNYWKDDNFWIGYLDEWPDYLTQGTSLEDLKVHLMDLFKDLSSGKILNARCHAELELARIIN